MPLTKIAFAPGIDKQDTEYGAAGRWTDSDWYVFVTAYQRRLVDG